jgi:parallel beta-helix repeat protein
VQGIYHSNLRGHIMNNIVYRAWAYGIHLWHAPKNVVIANNLVFQNGEAGVLIGAGDAPGDAVASGMVVANNMILDNPASTWGKGHAIVESGLTGTDNKYINNLIWNNKQGIRLQNGNVAIGTFNTDPQLLNYQANGRAITIFPPQAQ